MCGGIRGRATQALPFSRRIAGASQRSTAAGAVQKEGVEMTSC